jgi:hypothetical protein
MATLTESIESREWVTGQKPSVTMHYILSGTTDDLTAKSLLLANTATVYDGLVRDECTLEPIIVDTVSDRGSWKCTVKYVSPDFSIAGAGRRAALLLRHGRRHPARHPVALDHRALPAKRARLQRSHRRHARERRGRGHRRAGLQLLRDPLLRIDLAILPQARSFNLTGKVNNASFKGMAAGECLFLGASGSRRGSEKWEINFRFAGSPNRSGIQIGAITGIAKKGWEYLWVRYADEADATAHALVKKPVGVYIERVYEEGNFSSLGIGT